MRRCAIPCPWKGRVHGDGREENERLVAICLHAAEEKGACELVPVGRDVAEEVCGICGGNEVMHQRSDYSALVLALRRRETCRKQADDGGGFVLVVGRNVDHALTISAAPVFATRILSFTFGIS